METKKVFYLVPIALILVVLGMVSNISPILSVLSWPLYTLVYLMVLKYYNANK